jgi:hypothetical protein
MHRQLAEQQRRFHWLDNENENLRRSLETATGLNDELRQQIVERDRVIEVLRIGARDDSAVDQAIGNRAQRRRSAKQTRRRDR